MRSRQRVAGIPASSGEAHVGRPAVARGRRRGGSRNITLARTAALALATPVVIAVSFRSWLLTRRASAYGGQVYRAPGNFINSPPGRRTNSLGDLCGVLFHLMCIHTVRLVRSCSVALTKVSHSVSGASSLCIGACSVRRDTITAYASDI